jgi:putative transposase
VHVTLRMVRGLPSLRTKERHRIVRDALRAVSARSEVRVVQYSVQDTHVHLILESTGKHGLSRGMQALGIRMAKALNRALGRNGQIFSSRYHARALKSPREVRNALLYVLHNARHHTAQFGRKVLGAWLDPCSSSSSFDAYVNRPPNLPVTESLLPSPRTWLLAIGWKRHGLLRVDEAPAT